MISVSSGFRPLLWLAVASLLFACDSEKIKQTEFSLQQNKFLLSLELVESAGKMLQVPGIKQAEIDNALLKMDQGIELAFEVTPAFLKRLDIRLPKLYSEMFTSGVQNYRLGVESSNREKQLEGLRLLSLWSRFWLTEKRNIQDKLIGLS
ncbi:MAG: hypothetical protein KAU21_00150 [Gammaproteobacteria bacterium]|nr:hypothetical protein [Gammaproteobacteria bacterium]